jgi:hypothetical protein
MMPFDIIATEMIKIKQNDAAVGHVARKDDNH